MRSKLEGGDGGMSNISCLRGSSPAKVAPTGDGKGTLYIFLHDKQPGSGPRVNTPVNGADLSSTYATEQYYIGELSRPGGAPEL